MRRKMGRAAHFVFCIARPPLFGGEGHLLWCGQSVMPWSPALPSPTPKPNGMALAPRAFLVFGSVPGELTYRTYQGTGKGSPYPGRVWAPDHGPGIQVYREDSTRANLIEPQDLAVSHGGWLLASARLSMVPTGRFCCVAREGFPSRRLSQKVRPSSACFAPHRKHHSTPRN
jgi:hypothetical protein